MVGAVLPAMLVLVVLAACGRDEQPSEPLATATATVVPLTPTPADPAEAEQAALAAYRGMWDAYREAGGRPEADPGDPALPTYAAGDALQVLVDGVTALRDQGLVTEGEVVLNPEVVELSPEALPTSARIEDCADTSGSSRVRVDGEPFNDEPGGHRLVIATIEVTDDGWKVVDFAVRDVGSC